MIAEELIGVFLLIVSICFIFSFPFISFSSDFVQAKKQRQQKALKLLAKTIQKNQGIVSEIDLFLAASETHEDIDTKLFASILKEQAASFNAYSFVSDEGVVYYKFPIERPNFQLPNA